MGADEIKRSGWMPKKNAIAKKAAPKRNAAKRAVKKTAAKKAMKRVAVRSARPVIYAADHGLMTAFHHMQRASMVMSLMEKGSGKDLRDLLKRGVKLYSKAMEVESKDKFVLCAIGVLRAVEHLA